jgi:small-conductance mechanosensitive channel
MLLIEKTTPGSLIDLSEIQNSIQPYFIYLLLSIVAVSFVLLIRFLLFKMVFIHLNPETEFKWKKNSYYFTTVISIIMVFIIWLPHLRTFFTIFSIIGTGLVVVLKEVFLNIAGWFYLLLRRPFEIGNRISINHFSGDVIEIRLLEFSMIEISNIPEGGQSTGRILRVPNSMLFTNPLLNASKDFSLCWNEIRVNLTLNSNWEKAARLLEKLANENLEKIYKSDSRLQSAEKKYSIKYNKIGPKVYVNYSDEKINLTLRHLSEPKKMRDINDLLWRSILETFKKQKDIYME